MLDLLPLDLGQWLPLLVDAAVKSLILAAAALAALTSLRRASAATRHLVLLAGLGVLLGLPALMPLLSRQTLPYSPRQEEGAASSAPTVLSSPAKAGGRFAKAQGFSPAKDGSPSAAPVSALPPLPLAPAGTPAPASPLPPIWPAWLVLGWLGGVLACAGRMFAAQVRVRRLTRRCPSLPPSLRLDAEAGGFSLARLGPAGTPPMVWGWPRAALLLPPEAAEWPAARLRAVLRHESAHVRRQDWLTQTLAQAAGAVYWFNPLVWLLAARMNAEAERACDDAVLLSGIPPTDYAQDLLAVARHLSTGAARRASFGAVTMVRRSPVRGRLEAILDTHRPRRRATRRATALSLCVALALAAPLAALRPAARADAPTAPPPAPQPGVPTEADIAKVQKHLQRLERDRLVDDWKSAQPNMLTPAQTALVDRLLELVPLMHASKKFDAKHTAQYQRARVEAKKTHNMQERQAIWQTIFGYEHDQADPAIAEQERARDLRFTQLQEKVDRLPAYQTARETKMYSFDKAIAVDRTQIETMQMEQSAGYLLHINVPEEAESGFYMEKRGWMSRADWVHVCLLEQKIGHRKRLDDADVASLIAILREPSKTPSVARITVLSLFQRLLDASPAQQQKIREAVTPFLTSQDKWDRKFAERVMKKFGGITPTPLGAAS